MRAGCWCVYARVWMMYSRSFMTNLFVYKQDMKGERKKRIYEWETLRGRNGNIRNYHSGAVVRLQCRSLKLNTHVCTCICTHYSLIPCLLPVSCISARWRAQNTLHPRVLSSPNPFTMPLCVGFSLIFHCVAAIKYPLHYWAPIC